MRLASKGLGQFFLGRFTKPTEANSTRTTVTTKRRVNATLRVRPDSPSILRVRLKND